MEKRCVYTTLFGDYELINEQEVAKESDIDFLCYTDNPDLQSDTWKILYTEPIFPLDPIRNSRFVKICTHRYLPDYDSSLYIDNSVKLLVKPEIIFNDLLYPEVSFVLMKHSFRDTVLDEFNEVNRLKYEFLDRLLEQLNDYNLVYPNILMKKPYWTGFLIRRHNNSLLNKAMEDWFFQILRYSRRDQLSLNYIVENYNLNVSSLDMDNHLSIYHKWPTSNRLKLNIVPDTGIKGVYPSALDLSKETLEVNRHQKMIESQLLLFNQKILSLTTQLAERDQTIQSLTTQLAERDQTIQSLTTQLAERDQTIQSLNYVIQTYEMSNSWKITRPLRQLGKFLKK